MTGNKRPSPFDDLRSALDEAIRTDHGLSHSDGQSVRVDPRRLRRTGIPEIVHAENKSAAQVAQAVRALAEANGRAIASRVAAEHVAIVSELVAPGLQVESYPTSRALVAAKPGAEKPVVGGVVGILCAGTSDIPIAAEAALVATEMGARVIEAWDVGVAGLHRLVGPLEQFANEGVEAIVVAAGMDGALPSVVAGLVDVPVIGLPTAVGYGLGGAGVGALTTMLQSCALGLVVVNIDNGVGAGATAALIANRASRLRGSGRDERRDERVDRPPRS